MCNGTRGTEQVEDKHDPLNNPDENGLRNTTAQLMTASKLSQQAYSILRKVTLYTSHILHILLYFQTTWEF
jgi:hypothetical protein